jgi:hypothetical protein
MLRRYLPVLMGGGAVDLDAMTLEEAMLYLFDVAYWPMTEEAGNAIDHKNGFNVTWSAGGVTRANYALPNGDSIPTFDGTGEGTMYTTAFRDAFPYNKGSIVAVMRVPDVATWETDATQRNVCYFSCTGATNYLMKSSANTLMAYRTSNTYFDVGGMTSPALIGVTWDTTTGVLQTITNGNLNVVALGSQAVATVGTLLSNYTRIGAYSTASASKWAGNIGHFGLSNKVVTAAQLKSIFNKIFPSARKFFIIGDSKSTGANFWPGYLQNALNTATGDYWTDGPRRYAIGGYDITDAKDFINANLAAETDTPEFVLINMGTNDARAATITAEAIFKADYHAVIAACQAKWPGVPIFCQRIYRADSAQTITNSGIINGYIDDIVASYATGVYDGPDDEVWAENGDAGATYLSAADHIHYSVAAHSVLAGLWAAILTPYL